MGSGHRLTIATLDPDPRATEIADAAALFGLELPREARDGSHGVRLADVILLDGDLDDAARERLESLLVDPLLQTGTWEVPVDDGIVYEIALLPGVTDQTGATVVAAADRLGVTVRRAAAARRVTLPAALDPDQAEAVISRLVANPVIERWTRGAIELPPPGDAPAPPVEIVAIRGRSDEELIEIDRERSLALDLAELQVIRAQFESEGRDPTDAELETLAQTWSEHCAHKSFRAAVIADDGEERSNLLAALRATTEEIAAPFVRSAFVGNAGIISYQPGVTIALKAETHNHPSAVEPFGGANTGVGGVIRDVLGVGHRPIAVTDVLCFGPPDLPFDQLPAGSLHPRRIRDGVIDGVADYGNKIGLPTVAGAVLYDPGYTTNPLVFAGCIGIAEDRAPFPGPQRGDHILVLGGRTGRDGIRGATFSSATMDATTGEVAGASVQIGDPITEKLLIDAIIGAEDLYSAITDCGAGGLSSAIGEMAEGIGAEVELARVPLKYTGLAAWEIWLSEAQERMVLAVPPDRLDAITQRCRRYAVEVAEVGTFTGDGRLVVRHHGETIVDLDTTFLHDGRPRRELLARMPRPDRRPGHRVVADPRAALLSLLAHRNIASKADIIHRYDHEIRGATVIRPLVGVGRDGPGDGVVLVEPHATAGIAIGIGVNPWYGMYDPEAMARAVVDEAIRNVVAVGADPDQVSLLDNFSWGDPRDPSTFGDLVAAVDGCRAAAVAHRAPFVSGKDSLNNTYVTADGQRRAVPPTLVITAVAHFPDVETCTTAELVEPGDHLVLIGTTRPEFAGSHLDLILGAPDQPGSAPQHDPDAPMRYRAVHRAIRADLIRACHDLSEGGLAVALAEMCIAGRFGARVDTLPEGDEIAALFAESTGRFLVEVHPEDLRAFRQVIGEPVVVLGEVTEDPRLVAPVLGSIALTDLRAAFERHRLGDPGGAP